MALELLAEMDRIHLQPDLITFATAITACERCCILALLVGPENKDGNDGDVPFAMICLDDSLPRKTLLMHLEASMMRSRFNPYQRTDSTRPLPI